MKVQTWQTIADKSRTLADKIGVLQNHKWYRRALLLITSATVAEMIIYPENRVGYGILLAALASLYWVSGVGFNVFGTGPAQK